MKDNTIAAISTAMGTGGIAIIRVVGEDAFNIVDKIFKFKNKSKNFNNIDTHTINYGYIYDEDEFIDEVLVSIMKAPNTFTKEDTVEINCHGGIIPTKKILELVLKMGARLAEPGEFTKRAFLNGRIDLSQAESVMDIINSKTEISLKNAVSQLQGNLSEEIDEIREIIVEIIANLEVSIDYPEEEDIDNVNYKEVQQKLNKVNKKIKELIETADTGKILKKGIKTAIVGRPNVGKSSLMNQLLKENRAIVTEIAGTTRDTLEEEINLKGIPLTIIDTAGIRDTEDIVEKIGVDRSKEYINKADLIFVVLDASEKLKKEDIEILKRVKDRNTIAVINKIDLDKKICHTDVSEYIKSDRIVEISALKKKGIGNLENMLKEMFFDGKITFDQNIIITNSRHKNCLIKAKKDINEALKGIENNLEEDFLVIDLKNAYSNLGEIIGKSINDNIINEIFERFCLGK